MVADGMGGEAAGEVASRIAVEVLGKVLSEENIEHSLERDGHLRELFLQAIREANDMVIAGWQARRELFGMGSTVVAAVYRAGRAHVCNLGDSRAYLVRGNQWGQLTRDHSIAAELAEAGQMTAEEARTHRLRNQLTRSLGQKPLEPHFAEAELQPGDRLVLCSDGLWDMLPDDAIAQIAEAYEDPQMAVAELIELANEAGGYDNITVIIVKALGDANSFGPRAAEPITASEVEAPGQAGAQNFLTDEGLMLGEDLPGVEGHSERGPDEHQGEPA